ncbi:DUF5701 family protein [Streptomyces sp. I05A-00742]|uniref:DUF5701 family protein n=1 Tax=Streptomyces sp. I05A-00742 TaxID=2732853 RepID=UPI0020172C2C|nr:DUF5701 family protein [Streptomyces sp. I05A-00742]
MNVTTVPSSPEQAREVRDGLAAMPSVPLPPDAEVSGDWVSAPGAGDGAVLYVHGGGFAHTMPDAERLMAYRLSKATGRPVLRVDYRLAPAHPYPSALEDLLAAWQGVLDRGVLASETLFFGESAGATLVLSALLELRRTGAALPGAAVAVSPITDFALTGASLAANDGKDVMSRAVLDGCRDQYLAGASPTAAPQSPLHGDLRGLPRLLLAAGTDEVLLDDARRFAEAADAAGVSVCLDLYEGMPHAFHLSSAQGDVLFDRMARWLGEPEAAPGFDAEAEFDRQVRNLIDHGYPALAGLDAEKFEALVAPLRAEAAALTDAQYGPFEPEAGQVPFLLVVARDVVPVEETMPRTTLPGGRLPGFVDRSFEPGSLERFVATEETEAAGLRAYLLYGVERGEEFCGVVPKTAMAAIAERGRTLLTIEEGIALITHFPEALVKNKCFSLGGSRCGDRRVPAIWISKKAPKLGWCWEGNPHTWLGMASAGGRRTGAV